MKKCRKIRAQAYVQRRIRAEGACLRSDRKIPTRTNRTRIVGSLSSNEFTGCLSPGVPRLRFAGRSNNRTTVPNSAVVPVRELRGVLGKPYCFNGIRKSKGTSQ